MLCNYHFFIISPFRLILITAVWDGKGKSHDACWWEEENKFHGTEMIQSPVAETEVGLELMPFIPISFSDHIFQVLSNANNL